jgi:hypothetical protein
MKVLLSLVLSFGVVSMLHAQEAQPQVPYVNHPIKVVYTNWRGETAVRSIVPVKVYFGSTDYHPEEQWLLEVWDVERGAVRVYALKDIKQWFVE